MYYPEIVQVVPYEDYTVYVYFSDGKIVCYDVSDKLNRGIFSVLKDKTFFIEKCAIMNDTLAWDLNGDGDLTKCIDIDPDMLYSLPVVAEKIS